MAREEVVEEHTSKVVVFCKWFVNECCSLSEQIRMLLKQA
jgi:hypothetical protein